MTAKRATKILVLGVSGMLGNAMLRLLAESTGLQVVGSLRTSAALGYLPPHLHKNIMLGVDAENADSLANTLEAIRPDVVVNCIGVVKQMTLSSDPLTAIPINSIFPHRVAKLSALANARFVHISTDCVFDGRKGAYREDDFPDANDLYGRSKLLGEVDYPNAITLRTSIIGHELNSRHGLVNWFLAERNSVKGFQRAIFSGLPTCELARILRDIILPHPELRGLFHVSAEAISKYDLLRLVARTYQHDIEILPDDSVKIDRSLNSDRFRAATGYQPPAWPSLIQAMHKFG